MGEWTRTEEEVWSKTSYYEPHVEKASKQVFSYHEYKKKKKMSTFYY